MQHRPPRMLTRALVRARQLVWSVIALVVLALVPSQAGAVASSKPVTAVLQGPTSGSSDRVRMLAFNFQPTGTPLAGGFDPDYGNAYSSTLGYGWVREDSLSSATHVGIDATANTRDRNIKGDQKIDTLIHMQAPSGVTTPIAWELAVPSGSYKVTVGVGDPSGIDSSHTVRVEGTKAVNAFVPTSTNQFATGTVTVNVTDGRLTVDAIGGTNTKLDYLTITPMSVGASPAFNFEPSGRPVPSGFDAETGAAYNAGKGYGWVREDSLSSSTHVPLDVSANTRDREVNGDQKVDTMIHMQAPAGSGNATPAAWEMAVAPGTYRVLVSVGDATNKDSSHTIRVEGTKAIDAWTPSAVNTYLTGTVSVKVTDGRLTIDAIGGTNTKLNYVMVTPAVDTVQRAEYAKWAGYPNVVPALRSMSSSPDDGTMASWQTQGYKYFYTAISSDYRFAGSMYAAAAAPDAVMARSNNLGLYFHQLLTQLTADSAWNWQTGIGKVNWAQVDQWVMQAKARGKTVMWTEPSHAWDEVKKNATALNYFKKWGSTVVVSYGTNFPDQVTDWARPGALGVSSAAGSLRGASIQAFNLTDQGKSVTSSAIKALTQDAVDSGSTFLEFSGASADLQSGSQFLAGAQAALSASPTQPAPTQPYPGTPAFTAILMGSSQKGWTTEAAQRSEYAKWIAYPNVQPAFRSMAYSKNDGIMSGWERDGYKYYWTAASSDYYPGQSSIYVPSTDAAEVLARPNNAGLYLHEVISHLAAHNGWDWRKAVWDTDWGRVDAYVRAARGQGKKVIWSEPSHAWAAVYNDASARSWFEQWGDTLVVSFATNFPDQINTFSKPAAQALASRFGAGLGDSVQSWHFWDQLPVNQRPGYPDPQPTDSPTPTATSSATLSLANDGAAAGATYFQVEGTAPDMQPGSPYMSGIRAFLDSLKSRQPAVIPADGAQRVPLYASMSLDRNDQALTRTQDEYASIGYYDQGIVGYVLDRQAPGTVPLHAMYSSSATDYFYTADPVEVARATGNDPAPWDIRYTDLGVIGWVFPDAYGDTVPLYQLWNNAADTNDHAYTTSAWLKGKFNSVGYTDQRTAAYIFDNDGTQTTYPLAQMWNNQTVDHFYTANSDEITQYAGMGYEYQKDVGMIGTEPVDGAVPVYEAYSGAGYATDHMYSTDPFEIRDNVRSWLKYSNVRVIGYMSPVATAKATRGVMKLWTNGEVNNVGYSDHMLTADWDERVYNEQSWRHYVYQDTIGYVPPVSYPTSTRFGGSDGAVNTTQEYLDYLDAQEVAGPEDRLDLRNGLRPAERDAVDNYFDSLEWSFESSEGEDSTPMPAPSEALTYFGMSSDNYATRMAAGQNPDVDCRNSKTYSKMQKRVNYGIKTHTYTYNRGSGAEQRIYRCWNKSQRRMWVPQWNHAKFYYKYNERLTNHYLGKNYIVRWQDAGWRRDQQYHATSDSNNADAGNRLEQDFEVRSCSDKQWNIIFGATLGQQAAGGFNMSVGWTKAVNSCKVHLEGMQGQELKWDGSVKAFIHRT